MRLRQFTQDDAHLFCTEYGILDEIKNYIVEHNLKFAINHFALTLVTVVLGLYNNFEPQ